MQGHTKKILGEAKLKTYIWQGMDRHGKPCYGENATTNFIFIKAQLQKQGITITSVQRKPYHYWKTGMSAKEITLFSRQLASMLLAGIALIPALELIANSQEKIEKRIFINKIKNNILQGNSMANALRQYPHYFDQLYCNLIVVGECSGCLDTMLDRIANYKEQAEILRSKIRKALVYPLVIVGVALLVSLVILLFVVPQFQQLFANFGEQLPSLTRAVITCSQLIKTWWWLGLILIVGVIIFVKLAQTRLTNFNYLLQHLFLHIPALGKVSKKIILVRFTRTLATTFAAGLPLTEALNLTAEATGSMVFQKVVSQIRQFILQGQTLRQALDSTKFFPALVIQMIAMAEESGTLETMLQKISSFYEQEVDEVMNHFNTLLEPAIMLVLGGLVGGLVLAMYLPIFKISSVI